MATLVGMKRCPRGKAERMEVEMPGARGDGAPGECSVPAYAGCASANNPVAVLEMGMW